MVDVEDGVDGVDVVGPELFPLDAANAMLPSMSAMPVRIKMPWPSSKNCALCPPRVCQEPDC